MIYRRYVLSSQNRKHMLLCAWEQRIFLQINVQYALLFNPPKVILLSNSYFTSLLIIPLIKYVLCRASYNILFMQIQPVKSECYLSHFTDWEIETSQRILSNFQRQFYNSALSTLQSNAYTFHCTMLYLFFSTITPNVFLYNKIMAPPFFGLVSKKITV